jgi:5-formyltetrahydrofolate cyclo-ligase
VPGSVFDTHCNRFGYGGGFYDRFLSMHAPQAIRIALAFDFQVQRKIDPKPHDEPMDIIVTEKRTIRCTKPDRQAIHSQEV